MKEHTIDELADLVERLMTVTEVQQDNLEALNEAIKITASHTIEIFDKVKIQFDSHTHEHTHENLNIMNKFGGKGISEG